VSSCSGGAGGAGGPKEEWRGNTTVCRYSYLFRVQAVCIMRHSRGRATPLFGRAQVRDYTNLSCQSLQHRPAGGALRRSHLRRHPGARGFFCAYFHDCRVS